MNEIQPIGGSIKPCHPQHNGVFSWEIERSIEYRKVLGRTHPRPLSGRWFLRATVTEELFAQLVVALQRVGVSEPWGDGSRNAPAVFKSMTRRSSLSESTTVTFELEAFDLRIIERDRAEKGINQDYFLEPESKFTSPNKTVPAT